MLWFLISPTNIIKSPLTPFTQLLRSPDELMDGCKGTKNANDLVQPTQMLHAERLLWAASWVPQLTWAL